MRDVPKAPAFSRLVPRSGLGLLWVLATTFGWMAGLSVVQSSDTAQNGPVIGLIIGAAQWLVLRTRVRRSRWWVLATAAGWAIGMSLGQAAVGVTGISGALGAGAILGIVMGAAQWPVLRASVPGATWWVPASAGAWAFAWAAAWIMDQASIVESSGESFLPAIGMMVGIITAYPLVRLLDPGGRPADLKDVQ